MTPQLDRLLELTAGRELDAVLVSVGANDIGFSDIVLRCGRPDTCSTKAAVLAELEEDLGGLPASYDLFLRRLLLRTGAEPARVLVSEYFNPTRNENGHWCGARQQGSPGCSSTSTSGDGPRSACCRA